MRGRALKTKTARVFEPLLAPARYKGAHGGRGSGKSHFFAERLVVDSVNEPGDSGGEGLRSVCIREVQKDLAQSAKILIELKMASLGVGESDGFKIFRDNIQTPGDGIIIFKGMNDYTAVSIKCLEGFMRGWWEEAQTATAHSVKLYRPTLRADGAERWFSWNPRRKTDPVDLLLRGPERPTGCVVVQSNWDNNPFKPAEQELERLDTLRTDPDQYQHVWEGAYVSLIEGAYYAKALTAARAEHRISHVAADPLMTYHPFFDIGGTGAKADAVAIWIAQFIGKEVRALNYYEAVSQPLATHLAWMREEGYKPGNTKVWLPHDGAQGDKVFDVSYQSAVQAAQYEVEVVPNQGKGAAKMRIESGRRYFPNIWFNEPTTSGGIDALGWYHEKKDELRDIGLGPEHDWSSHGSDAFGLMCVAAEQIMAGKPHIKDPYAAFRGAYAG